MPWRAKLSQSVREFRFLLNPRAPSSAGLSSFISNNYPFFKTLNPDLNFLVREYPDDDYIPTVTAEYDDFGEEHSVNVTGFTEKQIFNLMKEMHEIGLKKPTTAPRDPLDDIVGERLFTAYSVENEPKE
mmetsp:Transcript_70600/g.147034  ORF Transcript_70600/g.147034 Transcript_70600/m.147034 type:complete len:129 (+) Transcript_70600:35-421(+)